MDESKITVGQVKSPIQKTNNSNNILMFIVILFGLIILIGGVSVAIFFVISKDESAKEEQQVDVQNTEELSNEDIEKEEVAEIPEGFTLYESEKYSIIKPEEWFVQEGSVTYFSEEKIGSNKEGTYNDNYNIVTVANDGTELDEDTCSELAETSVEQYKSLFDDITTDSTDIISTTNYGTVCRIRNDAVLKGFNIIVHQYVYISDDGEKIYVITFGLNKEGDNLDIVEDVADSFKLN